MQLQLLDRVFKMSTNDNNSNNNNNNNNNSSSDLSTLQRSSNGCNCFRVARKCDDECVADVPLFEYPEIQDQDGYELVSDTDNEELKRKKERRMQVLEQVWKHSWHYGRPPTSFIEKFNLKFAHIEYDYYRRRQILEMDFEKMIVFEDHRYIVFNKPYDLRIDGDAHEHDRSIALHVLLKMHRADDVPQPPKFVHQLDYATSGILVIGKLRRPTGEASKLFQARQTTKFYSAMLQGHVESDEIFIDQPIGHLAESEHRMCVEPTNGKVAQTHLTVLKRGYYFDEPATWVRLKPITGRTHQLRVHCAFVGHPIVGDFTYGRNDESPRMMLHAAFLHLPFPKAPSLSLQTVDPFEHLITRAETSQVTDPLVVFVREQRVKDDEKVKRLQAKQQQRQKEKDAKEQLKKRKTEEI